MTDATHGQDRSEVTWRAGQKRFIERREEARAAQRDEDLYRPPSTRIGIGLLMLPRLNTAQLRALRLVLRGLHQQSRPRLSSYPGQKVRIS